MYLSALDDDGEIAPVDHDELRDALVADAQKLGDMMRQVDVDVTPDKLARISQSMLKWIASVGEVKDPETRVCHFFCLSSDTL